VSPKRKPRGLLSLDVLSPLADRIAALGSRAMCTAACYFVPRMDRRHVRDLMDRCIAEDRQSKGRLASLSSTAGHWHRF
jgi:hypothetical protein